MAERAPPAMASGADQRRSLGGVEDFGIDLQVSELVAGDDHGFGHARHLPQFCGKLAASPALPSASGSSRVVR